jgi:HAD superfamily hydrolase (TIGR01509 family)
MLRAIVFDFDGVIANSEPLHLRAYQAVLEPEGIALADGDYYARYLGYDDVGAFAAIGKDRGRTWTPAEIERLVQRKAVQFERLEHEVSVLFPGAADAVRRAAIAYPIAIASGARAEEIHRVLAREALTSCFTAIVAAEDTPRSKPSPDPYLHVVERLRNTLGPVQPEECVALEDSRWGLQSARAAGLRTVAVAQTYERSALADADLVIETIDEMDLLALARLCGS